MPMRTMHDANTSPANSNPVATTDMDWARRPTMILLHASVPLTTMPAMVMRRAVRYDSSRTVTALLCPNTMTVGRDLLSSLNRDETVRCGDDVQACARAGCSASSEG